MSLEEKIVKILVRRKKTLALAESCSGGLLSSRITDVPGASKCLQFTLVAYSNAAKIRFLKVPQRLLNAHGAVSEPVALAMASSCRQIMNADYALSITGIAGPTGGNQRKPIGLTYIALRTRQGTYCLKHQFKGSRKSIKQKAATAALKLLLDHIQ